MKAYFLSLKPETPARDYWDYGFVEDFLAGNMWRPKGWKTFQTEEVDRLPTARRAIVIIPARHHAGLEDEINNQLKNIKHVVLFLLGDEEADFDIEKIKHPSMYIWVQNPHPVKHDNYNRIGTGYPPQLKQHHKNTEIQKDLVGFFSGQITHIRREKMIEALEHHAKGSPDFVINKTAGFTQGFDHPEYYKYMRRAKIVPCPSGAVIPDSFRLFEALESMAIPIGDEVNPSGSIESYWDWLFEDITPFPKVKEWSDITSIINETLSDYPHNLHKQTEWWIGWKRTFAVKVWEQLNG